MVDGEGGVSGLVSVVGESCREVRLAFVETDEMCALRHRNAKKQVVFWMSIKY